MSDVFDKLTPSQLTAVICTLAGAVALVAMITAIWSYQVRALADQTALERERLQADIAMQKEQVQAGIAMKQELLKRNLPPAELKLALEAIDASSASSEAEGEDEPADSGTEGGTDENAALVLKQLASCADAVDSETVEETIALVAATDPAALGTLGDVLNDCISNDKDGDTIYAIARAFCKANPKPVDDAEFERAVGE
jgi:hypothetical protein